MDVIDLRGKPLGDPAREMAYPRETGGFGEPMRYLHLESTNWYFDASEPANQQEAARVLADLCFRAETWDRSYCEGYRPVRVVVDNFGGTIVGERVTS